MRKALLFLLIFAILLCSAGCDSSDDSSREPSENKSTAICLSGLTPNEVAALDDLSGGNASVTDFAIRLFKATATEEGNTLISPLSVLCALSMTANGAQGKTLEEIEATLGMKIDELNLYLYSYINSLSDGEKYKLDIANSIWFRDNERLNIEQDFLQTNADYYGADIYKAPFDNQTVKDINNWVKNTTDNMIPEIIDRIPDEAVMYLINTLLFEAEWSEMYEETQVHSDDFTKENGEKQTVEFMYSTEWNYLEDENAAGFIKYYSGAKYAFVALLPNEGITVSEYIETIDGEALSAMLMSPERVMVKASIPKFKTEYTKELSEILKSMGMTSAFDINSADFERIGSSTEGNIFIDKVIHKTNIQVGEKGTKAGAVTSVIMGDAASPPFEEIKEVYLDRPFVYMLIDCENNVPFFIGSLMSVDK